jgi:iron complex outermembrane receptor protein
MKHFCIWLLLAFSTRQVIAHEDSTAVDLKQITIMENRLEIPFSKVSRNIAVIQRKSIETTPARSIQELLSFTPGVDVRQRGVSGVQANIGIRGGSFEQTLMLLNGIKLTDPQTGNHMMNIPVPFQSIQRIEVLKGPGSRIFGQNAFAGAINIITELPETRSLNIQGFGGDFGMWGGHVISSLPICKYNQTLSISHDASDGHWYNSDFKVSNVFYESGFELNENHEFNAMMGFSDRTFGANGFYTNAFPDQWESLQTYLSALSHTYRKGGVYLQNRAYWRRNIDEFRLRRNEPQFFTNNHVSDVLALEINGAYTSKFGTTGLGIEGRNERIDSNNLGKRGRQFLGLFAEHRIEFLEKFDARVGIYSNLYDEFGWRHFPGAEMGYQLNDHSRFYSNFGASYRIPSFTELYYEDPSNFSNSNLLPEESWNYEFGWKIEKNKMRGEVVYFYRFTENLIDYTREPSDIQPNPNRWTPRNVSQVTFKGVETSLQYLPNLGGHQVKLTELSLSYNFINADLVQAEGVESRIALNSLRHQVIAGLHAELIQKIELTIKGRYIERMALDSYFLVDSRLDFNRLKKLGFFLEVSNLTNTDYIESGFVQMPGRWAKAGFSIRVD